MDEKHYEVKNVSVMESHGDALHATESIKAFQPTQNHF